MRVHPASRQGPACRHPVKGEAKWGKMIFEKNRKGRAGLPRANPAFPTSPQQVCRVSDVVAAIQDTWL